jgi:hypothetical protein
MNDKLLRVCKGVVAAMKNFSQYWQCETRLEFGTLNATPACYSDVTFGPTEFLGDR